MARESKRATGREGRVGDLVRSLGSFREAEDKTNIPRTTLGQLQQKPKSAKLSQLQRLAEATGASIDWMAGADVPRELKPRTHLRPGLTREQINVGIYAALASHPVASLGGGLSPSQVRALEAWGSPDLDAVDRAIFTLATSVRENARTLVAGRLDVFADELERLQHQAQRAIGRPSDETTVMRALRIANALPSIIRAHRLEAVAIRAGHEDARSLPGYFHHRVAGFHGAYPGPDREAHTRFRVPGGIAWGTRDDREDTVWYFREDYGAIVKATRKFKEFPLLFIPDGGAPDEETWPPRDEPKTPAAKAAAERNRQRLIRDVDKHATSSARFENQDPPTSGRVVRTLPSIPFDPLPAAEDDHSS